MNGQRYVLEVAQAPKSMYSYIVKDEVEGEEAVPFIRTYATFPSPPSQAQGARRRKRRCGAATLSTAV